MNKKDNNVPQLTESSILFQLPNSMFSFNEMSSNAVLMPVAIDQRAEVQSNTAAEANITSDLSDCSTFPISNSICQLEQPLFPTKSSVEDVQPDFVSQPSICFEDNPNHSSAVAYPCETLPNVIPSIPCPGFTDLFAESQYSDRTSSFEAGEILGKETSSKIFCPVSCAPHINPPSEFLPKPCGELNQFLANLQPGNLASESRNTDLLQMLTSSNVDKNLQENLTPSNMYPTDSISDRNYTSVKPHWLFKDVIESKEVWFAFSNIDSENLEKAFVQGTESVVSTDGGRYDVHLNLRIKKSVYFDAKDLHVRRATWFQRNGSTKFMPYEEETSNLLEQHFCKCVTSSQWQRRFNISGIGSFVFESFQVMLHYKNELEVWPALPDSKRTPLLVKRGLPDGFEILPDETFCIDNLVFIVQGIGSFCDLRFRTVSQCVDGLREIANKLVGAHFKNEIKQGLVGRVEFLPVAWHAKLHTNHVGLDRRMQEITLPSIPKLRHFTNDTLIDILLYSSQSYCQVIIDTVSTELNNLFDIFISRNPKFTGNVFIAGHSLGSLILFDILSNQTLSEDELEVEDDANSNKAEMLSKPLNPISMNFSSVESLLQSLDLSEFLVKFQEEKIDFDTLTLLSDEDLKNMGVPTGPRKKLLKVTSERKQEEKLLPSSKRVSGNDGGPMVYCKNGNHCALSPISYPSLKFKPAAFFALGSPISMFLAVRGYEKISDEFQFPTCPSFFHIFHPYDPVAFRIEPLIDPNFTAKPVLIPHHKGRKRLHLEIRENVTKIASDIKQTLMDTMRLTWNSLSGFSKTLAFPSTALEAEVDKLVEVELSEPIETLDSTQEDIKIGLLNRGRRIDYVLQEKPIEALNDYVFALTSHSTYWDSEDTVLMILKEIYAIQGITLASQLMDTKSSLEKFAAGDHSSETLQSEYPLNTQVEFDSSHHPNSLVSCPSGTLESQNYESNTNIAMGGNANASISANDKSSSTLSHLPDAKANIGPPPLSGFVKRSLFTH